MTPTVTDRESDPYLDDIPKDLASRAYQWLCQDPEGRGIQSRLDYADRLAFDLALFQTWAKEGGTEALVSAEFARYRDGLRRRWIAALASSSRCASAFICGPAKFPVRKMAKRHDIADRRWQELLEFQARARTAIRAVLVPGQAPIRVGDPDAAERLRERIAELEAKRERYHAINTSARRRIPPSPPLSEGEREELRVLAAVHPDAKPGRFPPYALQNLGAEIRRLKQRVAEATRVSTVVRAPVQIGQTMVFWDLPRGRVAVEFPGKPAPAVISALKARGFHWNRTRSAWTRPLTEAAWNAALEIAALTV